MENLLCSSDGGVKALARVHLRKGVRSEVGPLGASQGDASCFEGLGAVKLVHVNLKSIVSEVGHPVQADDRTIYELVNLR